MRPRLPSRPLSYPFLSLSPSSFRIPPRSSDQPNGTLREVRRQTDSQTVVSAVSSEQLDVSFSSILRIFPFQNNDIVSGK